MLTAFNPFTDYDRKSSGHCWGAGDQSLHLRCFGGETTEVITVEKTTCVGSQLCTRLHVQIRLILSKKVPTKTAFFRWTICFDRIMVTHLRQSIIVRTTFLADNWDLVKYHSKKRL